METAKWAAICTAIVGASATLSTFVYQQQQIGIEEKRAELEESQHQQSTKMEYLRAAIDPSYDPDTRSRVLRYLKLALEGDALQQWASSELANTEQRASELNAELAAAEQQVEAARKERDAAQKELLAAQQQSDNEKAELETKLVAAEQRLDEFQQQKRSVEEKSGRRPRTERLPVYTPSRMERSLERSSFQLCAEGGDCYDVKPR
jgi:hypothetical protein